MRIEFDNGAIYEQVKRQSTPDNLGMDGFCSDRRGRGGFDEGREGVVIGWDGVCEHVSEKE